MTKRNIARKISGLLTKNEGDLLLSELEILSEYREKCTDFRYRKTSNVCETLDFFRALKRVQHLNTMSDRAKIKRMLVVLQDRTNAEAITLQMRDGHTITLKKKI